MSKTIGYIWFVWGLILWLVMDQTWGIAFYVLGIYYMINGDDDEDED